MARHIKKPWKVFVIHATEFINQILGQTNQCILYRFYEEIMRVSVQPLLHYQGTSLWIKMSWAFCGPEGEGTLLHQGWSSAVWLTAASYLLIAYKNCGMHKTCILDSPAMNNVLNKPGSRTRASYVLTLANINKDPNIVLNSPPVFLLIRIRDSMEIVQYKRN